MPSAPCSSRRCALKLVLLQPLYLPLTDVNPRAARQALVLCPRARKANQGDVGMHGTHLAAAAAILDPPRGAARPNGSLPGDCQAFGRAVERPSRPLPGPLSVPDGLDRAARGASERASRA